jgi:hypothetical protein
LWIRDAYRLRKTIVIEVFIILFVLLGLAFVVVRMRELASSEGEARTPVRSNFVLGLLSILVLFFIYLWVVAGGLWPPFWLEHHRQQQEVSKRIQSIGGWEALKRDAVLLAKQNNEAGFLWLRGKSFLANEGFTNYALPPAFAALNPSQVRLFNPRRLSQQFGDGPDVEVVEIKIFGMHSIGGHSTPYYGLELVRGPGTNEYRPQASRTALGNAHSTYRKIIDNVYEVY